MATAKRSEPDAPERRLSPPSPLQGIGEGDAGQGTRAAQARTVRCTPVRRVALLAIVRPRAPRRFSVLSQILLRRSCRGSGPCLWRGLGSQGVEQFGRSAVFVSGLAYHLSFLDHVHEFHTS